MIRVFEAMGRGTVRGFDELGYAAGLLGESLKWLDVHSVQSSAM